MVVLRFALELDQLEQIKVAAEVHKAGEVESLERGCYLVEGHGSFVLVFDCEAAVVREDYF